MKWEGGTAFQEATFAGIVRFEIAVAKAPLNTYTINVYDVLGSEEHSLGWVCVATDKSGTRYTSFQGCTKFDSMEEAKKTCQLMAMGQVLRCIGEL